MLDRDAIMKYEKGGFITTRDAAEILGVSTASVRRMWERGELIAWKPLLAKRSRDSRRAKNNALRFFRLQVLDIACSARLKAIKESEEKIKGTYGEE